MTTPAPDTTAMQHAEVLRNLANSNRHTEAEIDALTAAIAALAGQADAVEPFGYYLETVPPTAWQSTFTRAPEIAELEKAAKAGRVKVTLLYTTPPAAIPVDALRALVYRWRERVGDGGGDDSDIAIEQCADELTALLAATKEAE